MHEAREERGVECFLQGTHGECHQIDLGGTLGICEYTCALDVVRTSVCELPSTHILMVVVTGV